MSSKFQDYLQIATTQENFIGFEMLELMYKKNLIDFPQIDNNPKYLHFITNNKGWR